MDMTACPPGMFTDRILIYHLDDPTPKCDSPVAGWLVLSISLWVLRIALTYNQKYDRLSRPVIASWAGIITQAVLIAFVSSNLANTINSVSGVLYGLFVVPLSWNHMIYIRKIVTLGYKIIPISKPYRKVLLENQGISDLHIADNVVKLLTACSTVTSVSVLIVFIIGAAGFPGQFWPFEAGILLTATYQILTASIAVWQVQRCKNAIYRVTNETQEIRTANDDFEKQVRRAATKMSQQQFVIAIWTCAAATLCILCSIPDIVPMTWWLFAAVFFGGDTLMSFIVTVLPKLHLCKRKGKEANVTSKSSSNNTPKPMASKEIVALSQ